MKLLFVEQINLMENISQEAMALVGFIGKRKEKKVILIGDIGCEEKTKTYREKGKEAIVMSYKNRLESCNSLCQRDQLPKNDEEINAIIDRESFENIKESIIQDKKSYKDCIKQLVNQQTKRYKFLKKDLRVIGESFLRNRVGRRIKQSYSKTWSSISGRKKNEKGYFIDDDKVANISGIPLCRGIMFAFFEYMYELGIHEIEFFIEKKSFRAIYSGLELFNEKKPTIRGEFYTIEGKDIIKLDPNKYKL